MSDPWDHHAAWWQRGFTAGADPEYTEQILPLILEQLPRDGVMVDVGCGEGQVSRLAAELAGMEVVGVDPARAQVGEAEARGGGPRYVQAGATALPLRRASCDVAVACLVFEHIDGIDEALAEVARLLRPDGSFLLLLNHPLLQTPGSGWIDDQVLDPPEQYWRVGNYLDEAETVEQVERGVFITFRHRPLSRYLNAAFAVGLQLTHMDEPAPPPGFLARSADYADAASIPRLMVLRFERRPN